MNQFLLQWNFIPLRPQFGHNCFSHHFSGIGMHTTVGAPLSAFENATANGHNRHLRRKGISFCRNNATRVWRPWFSQCGRTDSPSLFVFWLRTGLKEGDCVHHNPESQEQPQQRQTVCKGRGEFIVLSLTWYLIDWEISCVLHLDIGLSY